MFTLKFDTDNMAFYGPNENEISRILRTVAEQIEYGMTNGTVHDINGNTVGKFKLTDS